jgi:hypothetical protein
MQLVHLPTRVAHKNGRRGNRFQHVPYKFILLSSLNCESFPNFVLMFGRYFFGEPLKSTAQHFDGRNRKCSGCLCRVYKERGVLQSLHDAIHLIGIEILWETRP